MSTNEPPPYPGDKPEPSSEPSATGGLPSWGSVPPPPGYEAPPPPPAPDGHVGPEQPYSAPAAIGWGWRKFTENVGPILAAVVVIFGVSIALSLVVGLASGSNPFSPQGQRDVGAGTVVLGIVLNILSTVVSIVLSAGFARATLDVADGGKFDFFGAFGRVDIVKVVLTSLLVSLVVVLGFVALILPGIILLFLTYFATWAIVDDATGPVDAVKRSVKLVGSNLGSAILLAILSFLTLVLGFLALCVGILVAYPVVSLAAAYSYRRFRGQPVAA